MARQRGRRQSYRQRPYYNDQRSNQEHRNHNHYENEHDERRSNNRDQRRNHNNEYNNRNTNNNNEHGNHVIRQNNNTIVNQHDTNQNQHNNRDEFIIPDNNEFHLPFFRRHNRNANNNQRVNNNNDNNDQHNENDNNNNNPDNNNEDNSNLDDTQNQNNTEYAFMGPGQQFVSFDLFEPVHNNVLIASLMNDINGNDDSIERVQRELSNLVERRRQLEQQVTEEERRLVVAREAALANGTAPLIDENGVTVTEHDMGKLQWYVYCLYKELKIRDDRWIWYKTRIAELENSEGNEDEVTRLKYQWGVYARDNLGCRLFGFRSWGGDHDYLYQALRKRGFM